MLLQTLLKAAFCEVLKTNWCQSPSKPTENRFNIIKSYLDLIYAWIIEKRNMGFILILME